MAVHSYGKCSVVVHIAGSGGDPITVDEIEQGTAADSGGENEVACVCHRRVHVSAQCGVVSSPRSVEMFYAIGFPLRTPLGSLSTTRDAERMPCYLLSSDGACKMLATLPPLSSSLL